MPNAKTALGHEVTGILNSFSRRDRFNIAQLVEMVIEMSTLVPRQNYPLSKPEAAFYRLWNIVDGMPQHSFSLLAGDTSWICEPLEFAFGARSRYWQLWARCLFPNAQRFDPIQSHHCLTSGPSVPVTLPPKTWTETLTSSI